MCDLAYGEYKHMRHILKLCSVDIVSGMLYYHADQTLMEGGDGEGNTLDGGITIGVNVPSIQEMGENPGWMYAI